MKRSPSKLVDAALLELWAEECKPDLFSEWELVASEWVDFWDWLVAHYCHEFAEFQQWCRNRKLHDE